MGITSNPSNWWVLHQTHRIDGYYIKPIELMGITSNPSNWWVLHQTHPIDWYYIKPIQLMGITSNPSNWWVLHQTHPIDGYLSVITCPSTNIMDVFNNDISYKCLLLFSISTACLRSHWIIVTHRRTGTKADGHEDGRTGRRTDVKTVRREDGRTWRRTGTKTDGQYI